MAKPIAYYDPDRKLARVVALDDVIPHPNADRLDLAIIDGWQVVVGRGIWKKGDVAVFCEVGSLLPITIVEFYEAARDGNVKTFGDASYAHIKSIKLRKELSQGFVCAVPAKFKGAKPGDDLTLAAGVLKYVNNPNQAQILVALEQKPAGEKAWIDKLIDWICGKPVTNFLPFPEGEFNRSKEDRVQNKLRDLSSITPETDGFEVSVKSDGNAMSVHFTRPFENKITLAPRLIMRDVEISLKPIHVGIVKATRLWVGGVIRAINEKRKGASRYYWPKFQTVLKVPDCPHTQMLEKLLDQGLLEKVQATYGDPLNNEFAHSITFQGELIGPGVFASDRENYEQVEYLQFLVYRTFINGEELDPDTTRDICENMDLDTVKILDTDFKLREFFITDEASGRSMLDVKRLLKFAEGPLAFAKGGQREGIVLKSNGYSDGKRLSVKVISNAFLLKNGDD